MIFEQGDIIAMDFSPAQGHEQAGYRPALVVSRRLYNEKTGFIVVCPITNTRKPFPMRVWLDGKTMTTGDILCDQLRTIDTAARSPRFIEKIPEDLLMKIIELVSSVFMAEPM